MGTADRNDWQDNDASLGERLFNWTGARWPFLAALAMAVSSCAGAVL